MSTDLPYFEPLVLFLKKSPELRAHFSDRSFFLDPNIDPTDIDKAIGTDAPRRNIIWVFPGDTVARINPGEKKLECSYHGTHTFFITILNVCDRDKFTLIKKDTGLELSGPVVDMMKIRNSVKEEVRRFARQSNSSVKPIRYFDLRWKRDSMIEYTENEKKCGFINATMEFDIDLN